MTTSLDGIESTANVGANGDFQLVAATKANTSESVTSSVSIKRGDGTLIVSGDLDGEQPAGQYRVGIKEFANNCCRTKASFRRG